MIERKISFFLVIDELHSYRGTPGTEVGYLLRAFLHRIGLDPESPQLRIISTSASVRDEDESRTYLQEFFGRSSKSFVVRAGERVRFDAPKKPDCYRIPTYLPICTAASTAKKFPQMPSTR